MIGTIYLKRDHTLALLLNTAAKHITELLVSHCLMAQLHTRQAIQFLVGIIHIRHLIYKPRTAIDVGIGNGHSLSAFERKNEILGIEHIEHGEYTVAIHLGHISLSLTYRREHPVHLLMYICIHQFLIATQFGGMVSTNAVDIVRCLILIECAL